jgi:3-dehydroquinate dehydratase / shikimate dehydrogenase
MAEALADLPRIAAEADCVELRLDFFQEAYDLATLLRARGDVPAVVTLRPPREGGKSPLGPSQRLRVLCQAAELGADYVDLEWDAASPGAIDALHKAGAQVLVSRHDFSGMPRLADDWWPHLASSGADIVKVVGTASDVRDCVAVFDAFRRADRPTVAIAMGAAGLISRILALREEQCLLSYAMLDETTSTASGQLSVREMREIYHVSRLRPTTRAFGLLGPHVENDRLSDYNAWFAADGADGVAVPVQVEGDADAAGIVDAFRRLPMSGWHIHGAELQTGVGQALDEIGSTACRQGKVNAVVAYADGRLLGEWVESPREQYALWSRNLI